MGLFASLDLCVLRLECVELSSLSLSPLLLLHVNMCTVCVATGTCVPQHSGELVLSCQLAELRSLLFLPLWYPRLADLRTSEQFSQDFPFYHGMLGLEMCAFSNLLTQVPGVKVKLPALQSKLFHPLSHLTSL